MAGRRPKEGRNYNVIQQNYQKAMTKRGKTSKKGGKKGIYKIKKRYTIYYLRIKTFFFRIFPCLKQYNNKKYTVPYVELFPPQN